MLIILFFCIIILQFLLVVIKHFEQKEKQFSRRHNPGGTRIFCPKCNNELVENGELLHDGNIVIKRCNECETISNWYFDTPVPLLIKRPIDPHKAFEIDQ